MPPYVAGMPPYVAGMPPYVCVPSGVYPRCVPSGVYPRCVPWWVSLVYTSLYARVGYPWLYTSLYARVGVPPCVHCRTYTMCTPQDRISIRPVNTSSRNINPGRVSPMKGDLFSPQE